MALIKLDKVATKELKRGCKRGGAVKTECLGAEAMAPGETMHSPCRGQEFEF